MSETTEPESREQMRLRAALHRALGGERAPEGLRAQIAQSLRGRREPERPRVIAKHRASHFSARRAVAAGIVLAISAATFFVVRSQARPTEIADPIAQAIIFRHDSCARQSVHAVSGVALDDLDQLEAKLQERLKYPVLVANLDDGWKLVGGAFCPVRNSLTAHLLYKRGDEALSIFSIDGKLFSSPADGTHYQSTESRHAMSAFVRSQTVYCVVLNDANGNIDLPRTRLISDQLESKMSNGGIAKSRAVEEVNTMLGAAR